MHWLLFTISIFSTECECNKFGTVNSTHEITGNSTCQCKEGFSVETCHDFRILLEVTKRRDFIVTCNGPCKNIRAEIIGTGDADLYAGTVLPVIEGSDCGICFCQSFSSDYPEYCVDINLSDSDRFFLTVNHYQNAIVNLTVLGDNLADVVETKS